MKIFQFVVVSAVLGLLSGLAATAFTPSTNSKGVTWVSESAEGWSGAALSNNTGAILHLAGAFDSSPDATNHAGVTAHLGLLDPVPTLPVTPTPVRTSTPTRTATRGTTSTPTSTCPVDESSFDLDGDGQVNARDLIVLLTSIKAGTNLHDLNCDGVTDEADLQAFSVKWQIKP